MGEGIREGQMSDELNWEFVSTATYPLENYSDLILKKLVTLALCF